MKWQSCIIDREGVQNHQKFHHLHLDTFEKMWFDFEIMGWNIVIINWIPDFIKKENLNNICVNNYASGIYFLNIKHNNKTIAFKKVVIE